MICDEDDYETIKNSSHTINVPHCVDCLQGILSVIPLQLLSFHLAVLRGYDVSVLFLSFSKSNLWMSLTQGRCVLLSGAFSLQGDGFTAAQLQPIKTLMWVGSGESESFDYYQCAESQVQNTNKFPTNPCSSPDDFSCCCPTVVTVSGIYIIKSLPVFLFNPLGSIIV